MDCKTLISHGIYDNYFIAGLGEEKYMNLKCLEKFQYLRVKELD